MIVSGLLKQARFIESPHYNERPDADDISLLVIHNISLPPGNFSSNYVEKFFQGQLEPASDPYFQKIADLQVSAHLYIRRRGEIIQFVPFQKRAWHAGVSNFKGRENCNDFSIGIELEGTDELEYTDEQYDALIEVTRYLQQKYPKITNGRIVGHCDIAPQRKTDPGESFDWTRYLDSL
ncbi:1,6-anhydro-N-acetylmuramyl-L-alanine amidase AmpD [Aliikangiella coralliicola]|uniref:1,6-anhydro-N-acetylmuramyl-L-alanine amidase AmpD n=2 Tax=Aliikangiella coralliicola TaxID=2592383 RepID=A0A545U0N4_9GAMM|nr:1,6-anhydro-N-acetylmuramyl-L-alanine amidase AmpD [Aliikangiella coralliicola]TQV83016.1 1,6-anhydro-N-acetylmuramyl-L-alanine amidase AmpD [Aliikangiella coralliicola]